METRALIVAIEDYPNAKGVITQKLDGVHASARRFYCWLKNGRKLKPHEIYICSDDLSWVPDAVQPIVVNNKMLRLRYGATQPEVTACIADLKVDGTNVLDELYAYYAGHGFSFADDMQGSGRSYLLTAEYEDPSMLAACVDLDTLQIRMARSFAGLRHVHFVDACRNRLHAPGVSPAVLTVSLPPSDDGEASCFVLYSARDGSTAAADAAWSKALTDGLSGVGYAKVLSGGDMWVTFAGLRKHLKYVLGKSFERKETGDDSGELYRLQPVPPSVCTVQVPDAALDQESTVTVTRDGATVYESAFLGPTTEIELQPSGESPYTVQVTQGGQRLSRESPPSLFQVDMFNPCVLVFARPSSGGHLGFGKRLDAWPAKFQKRMPSDSIVLTDLLEMHSPARQPVPVEKSQRQLRAALTESLDLETRNSFVTGWANTAQSWLACAGLTFLQMKGSEEASAIVRKLDRPGRLMPLEDSLLVLCFSAGDAPPHFALHLSGEVVWMPMRRALGVDSLWIGQATAIPVGHTLLSLAFSGREPVTYTTWTGAAFQTLFIADSSAGLEVQQFFPPRDTDSRWCLPATESHYLNLLETARVLSEAQRRFALRKPILRASFLKPAAWERLLTGEWRNEDLLALCAYDLRRGRGYAEKFGDLRRLLQKADGPYGHDISLLLGAADPPGKFLLSDALLRSTSCDPGYEASRSAFHLEKGRLDSSAMWTAWRGAVDAPAS